LAGHGASAKGRGTVPVDGGPPLEKRWERKMSEKMFRVSLTLELEALDIEDARRRAGVPNHERLVISHVGFRHADGVVRECDEPPVGHVLHEVVSEYYGNHPERGEGDRAYYFAVPLGCPLPMLNFSHGSLDDTRNGLETIPAKTLVWNNVAWVPWETIVGDE
jgi:hypothetical protein